MDKHHRIEERAYFLWERAGWPHGRDREHWALAEAEIETAEARDRGAAAARAAAGSSEAIRPMAADKPTAGKPRSRKKRT